MSFDGGQRDVVEFIGPWYRIGALLWDLLIMAALAVALIAGLIGDQFKTEHGRQMAGLLLLSLASAYTLGGWILFARTPGQWLCSSRVVDFRSGGRPRPWQCLLRFILAPLSLLALTVGFLWAIRQRHRRTWHDLLSRTAVIGDASLRAPDDTERAEASYCIQQPPWLDQPGAVPTGSSSTR